MKKQNETKINPIIHLIGGILKTVCGKELEEVNWGMNADKATCKSCLRQKHPNYPRRIR